MVNDVMLRKQRLDLARDIIRAGLKANGQEARFAPVQINQAAWAYLKHTRLNTARLRAKLRMVRHAANKSSNPGGVS